MQTITATNARANFFQILKNNNNTTTRVSFKGGASILISEENYNNIIETAELLSISGMQESITQADKEIEKGELYDIKDVL